jgi:hypothetical protein
MEPEDYVSETRVTLKKIGKAHTPIAYLPKGVFAEGDTVIVVKVVRRRAE